MRSINKKVLAFSAILLIASNMVCYAKGDYQDIHQDNSLLIIRTFKYIFIFCVTILPLLFTITLICKRKINRALDAVSSNLKSHPFLAIITSGILLIIPLVTIFDLLFFGLLSEFVLFLFFLVFIAYPLLLVRRSFRETWLLSPQFLKWSFLFSISAVIATLLFIHLTNKGLLLYPKDIAMGATNEDALLNSSLSDDRFYSIIIIWGYSLSFLFEIVLALIFYGIGATFRIILKFKNRNQDSLPDDFDDLPEID